MTGDRDLTRRIKETLDIVDVVGSYIELTQRGTRHVALCPFHNEKTPSFSVNSQNQFYYCFGCRQSGDIFDFVMAMESVSFVEALKVLGDRCGIDVTSREGNRGSVQAAEHRASKTRLYTVLEAACLEFEENLAAPAGAAGRDYLKNRGFSREAIKPFRIGFASAGWTWLLERLVRKGFTNDDLLRAGLIKKSSSGKFYDLFRERLIFPILDIQGRVVGFGGRVLDGSEPKYINSPETEIFQKSSLLFGLDKARPAITKKRVALVVEGYTDVIMAHHRGVRNTIATLGTALTTEHTRVLRRIADGIYLLFDGDSAGAAAAERGVPILLAADLDVMVVPLEVGIDPCDFFRQNEASAFKGFVTENRQDFFDFSLCQLVKRFDARSPGGRAKIARELMSLIENVADPIKRDLVLTRIAENLDISEALLRREFRKRGSSTHPARDRGQPNDRIVAEAEARPSSRQRAEEDLLLGLLMASRLIEELRCELEQVHLEGVAEARILALLLDGENRDGTRAQPNDLFHVLREDQPARERLTRLLSDERQIDPETLVHEALDFLRNCRRNREYQRIRSKNKEIIDDVNSARGDEYLAELNRLLKEQDLKKRHRDTF